MSNTDDDRSGGWLRGPRIVPAAEATPAASCVPLATAAPDEDRPEPKGSPDPDRPDEDAKGEPRGRARSFVDEIRERMERRPQAPREKPSGRTEAKAIRPDEAELQRLETMLRALQVRVTRLEAYQRATSTEEERPQPVDLSLPAPVQPDRREARGPAEERRPAARTSKSHRDEPAPRRLWPGADTRTSARTAHAPSPAASRTALQVETQDAAARRTEMACAAAFSAVSAALLEDPAPARDARTQGGAADRLGPSSRSKSAQGGRND